MGKKGCFKYLDFYKHTKVTDTGCWVWQGKTQKFGYGILWHPMFPKETLAHRVSYLLNTKTIFRLPSTLCVLHRCDNPPCVNPDHLFIGTRKDNNEDRHKKGRDVVMWEKQTHCNKGHELKDRNAIQKKNGTKQCRICTNIRSNNNYHKRKQRELTTTNNHR